MTDVTAHQTEEDARNDSILIYLDGQIVPKSQAMVGVYYSGFMLGDGVWEGLRLYGGKLAFMDEHIDRLFEAAKAIDLNIRLDKKRVISTLLDAQNANAMTTDAHARLMVTLGYCIRACIAPQKAGEDTRRHYRRQRDRNGRTGANDAAVAGSVQRRGRSVMKHSVYVRSL